MSNTPKVTLIDSTGGLSNPRQLIETVNAIWRQSKTDEPLDQILAETRAAPLDVLLEQFRAVLHGVPVVEAISFNFVLEGISVSWREQMVRHRVGTMPDPRVGADWMMVDRAPEQASMTAWSQSMRLKDMSHFADAGDFRTPEMVLGGLEGWEADWANDMSAIQALYAKWAKRIPLEDARELIPLGAQHRIAWTLNLMTLQHIVGKRGCWILQLGLWKPVIEGMIEELAVKIHPVFRELVAPPCMKGDTYKGCLFSEDNERRLDGRDGNLPVCRLWMGRDPSPKAAEAQELYNIGQIRNHALIGAEADRREAFWGRDVTTGIRHTTRG